MIPKFHRIAAAILSACALGPGLLSGASMDSDLASAIGLGKRDALVRLLQAGVSPRDYADRGYSTLVVALRHGRDDMIPLLLEYQADPNEQESGVYPASLAAARGSGPALDLLIDRGAEINRRDASGRTPLSWAILGAQTESDHGDVIRRLVPLTRDYQMSCCDAAACGDVRALDMLLAAGAAVDTPLAASGRTALMAAAAQGQSKAVKWLLAHGARAQARDRHGRTALMLAAMGPCPHGDVAEVAIALPAPSTGAVCYVECATALIGGGAQVNEGDVSGNTPLMWAAMYGQTNVMRVLLRYDAKVNARSHSDETALIWAAREGHDAAAQQLLAAGADCNLQNHNQYSALSTAILHQHDRVADILLAAGAGANGKGFKGVTPLMLAVIKNRVSSVELLLRAKADVMITNDFGFTALDLPKYVGVKSVLQSLLQHPETLTTNLNMNSDR